MTRVEEAVAKQHTTHLICLEAHAQPERTNISMAGHCGSLFSLGHRILNLNVEGVYGTVT